MQLVETSAALTEMSRRVADEPRFHVDTEFDSTRQGAELCVVQVQAAGEIFVIDALRLRDLSPLAKSLGDPSRLWVLHAGTLDIPLLVRALGIPRPPSVFDTQIAWALTCAEPAVALGYLLYRTLGLRTTKAHQADDWKRRPLPKSQLEYAAADVEHLPAVYDELARRATALGRLAMVTEASAELWSTAPDVAQPISLATFRHAWQLDVMGQAGLLALVEWHNGLEPRSLTHIPEPKTLFAIASRMPESVAELGRIKGVQRGFCERQGTEVIERLRAARGQASAATFVPIEPTSYVTFAELEAEAWVALVRAEACAEATVAPEIAFPARLARRAAVAVREAGDARAVLEPLTGFRRDLLAAALERAITRRPLRDGLQKETAAAASST